MSVKSEQLNVILIGVMVLVGISSVIIQVDALTKVEIDALKKQIDILEKRIDNIENDIQVQKETILDEKKFLEEKKAELRLAKQSGTSWAAIENIQRIEREILSAEHEVKEAKEQLISLLNTKSDYMKKLANYKLSIQDKDFEPQPIPEPIMANQTLINQTDFNPKKMIISYTLTNLRNNIGIELSQSCLIMIKNNFVTNCPSYEDIINLDTSNTRISGNFITIDGFFHRDVPPLQKSWRWYDMDKTARIFVDPPSGMSDKIRMILIVPNFDTYYQKNDMIRPHIGSDNMQEQDRILYHDRYMKGCKEATINAGNWKNLLGDTITYMQNDCNPSFTQIDTVEIISVNKTQFDISTSWKWKNDIWMNWIKEFCLFTYGICKD